MNYLTLLHCCCAPCSVECVKSFKENQTPFECFFFNPNIHPYTEYSNRLNALKTFCESSDIKLIEHKNYDIRSFLNNMTTIVFPGRCSTCYTMRILETAKYASENGYKSFSTTLLISPYQNHSLITSIAEDASKQYNIPFIYFDLRDVFKRGQNTAREKGLYMQKYCGCIFSEEERFSPLFKSNPI